LVEAIKNKEDVTPFVYVPKKEKQTYGRTMSLTESPRSSAANNRNISPQGHATSSKFVLVM
jgi:hypothetical protein